MPSAAFLRNLAFYVLSLILAVYLYGVIYWLSGEVSRPAASPPVTEQGSHSVFLHVLVALAVVMVSGRLFGWVMRSFGQPRVVGEVLAGIALGPSLLGWVWPAGMAWLLPAEIVPQLSAIAQLGVTLYLFRVGLEFNTESLREKGHAAVAISHASIVFPFLLGAALSLGIYPRLAGDSANFLSFSLFMGIAMSVTAFPVLARILTDRGIERTPLGVMSLTCAASDDVTAWCLLALVVGVAKSATFQALQILLGSAAYVAVMLLVLRPLLKRFATRTGEKPTIEHKAILLIGCLISASLTEAIGIHALFGAFLFGALIPHESGVSRSLAAHLDAIASVLLLPAFFALTGLRTQIQGLDQTSDWLVCGGIILLATLGKLGGSYAAARWTGLPHNFSLRLGWLMNTRGLMELIVLNIGLELRVISPPLFAMMVLMAVATTVMTAPMLSWCERGLSREERDGLAPAA